VSHHASLSERKPAPACFTPAHVAAIAAVNMAASNRCLEPPRVDIIGMHGRRLGAPVGAVAIRQIDFDQSPHGAVGCRRPTPALPDMKASICDRVLDLGLKWVPRRTRAPTPRV
jgi:hypothetical protein